MKVARKIISGKCKAGERPCEEREREISNFKQWEIGVTQDAPELLGSGEITLWFFKNMKDVSVHY